MIYQKTPRYKWNWHFLILAHKLQEFLLKSLDQKSQLRHDPYIIKF